MEQGNGKSQMRQRRGVVSGAGAEAEAPAASRDAVAAPKAPEGSAKLAPSTGPSVDDGVELLDRYHRWLPFIIFLVAAFVRFYRLDCPSGVVFDESHFGRFTNQYTKGEFHFDIHPNLGKLTFWAVGKAVGYRAEVCNYTKIDDEYAPDCKFIWLRGTAAFFSSLTAPIMYSITRNFGGGARAGILAASLFIFDGLNSEEGRLVLTDSQLIFWLAACLLVGQWWMRRWNSHVEALEEHEAREARLAARLRNRSGGSGSIVAAKGEYGSSDGSGSSSEDPQASSAAIARADVAELAPQQVDILEAQLEADPRFMTLPVRLAWMLLVGVACGNAVSVKYTGLATPAFLGMEAIFAFFVMKRAYPFPDLLGILGVGVTVFTFYFWAHFQLLPYTGDGDVFMFHEFQRTLIGNPHYDPYAPKPSFWWSYTYLVKDMIVSNANILEPHAWESVWWEWILNLRGVLYYSVDQGHTYTRASYLLGNPVVIWLLIPVIVVSALLLVLWQRYRHEPAYGLARYSRFFRAVMWCLALYALNLLPYVAVKRSCFIYHYMPAMMYAQVLAGLLIEQLAGRYFRVVLNIILTAVVGVHLFFAPWMYAFALTSEGHERRRWLPRWN